MKWLARAALLLGGLAAGLALAEGATRWLDLDPVGDPDLVTERRWNQDCVQPAPGTAYEYKPGACGANSLGLRGDEPADPPPEGLLRILVLGDSIAADHLFADFLAERLPGRLGRPVEVYNAGVPGYATTNQLAWYRRHGPALQPDLVILQFCTNDYGFTPFLFRHGDTVLQVEDTTGAMSGRSLFLFERSALYRAVSMRGLTAGLNRFDFDARGPEIDAALVGLVDLAAERGQPLLVAIFPPLAPRDRWPERELEGWQRAKALLAEQAVPTIDLDPVFQAGPVGDLRRGAAARVLAELPAVGAARGLGRREIETLARDPEVRASAEQRALDGADSDITHPNFLGHHLAARAIEDALIAEWGDQLRR